MAGTVNALLYMAECSRWGQFALIMHIGTKFRWQINVRFALSYMQMHGIIKIPTIM